MSVLLFKSSVRDKVEQCPVEERPAEFVDSRNAEENVGIQLNYFRSNSKLNICMETLVNNASTAMKEGIPPILIEDCTGGAYYLRSPSHRISAVFKPKDEEPYAPNNPKNYVGSSIGNMGIKPGVPVGSAAIRECAAYLIDQTHTELAAGVPKTTMAVAQHSKFHLNNSTDSMKTGSLQEYIPHDCTAEDIGYSKYSVSSVHSIAILDIRLCNQDRHSGNILVHFDRSISSPRKPTNSIESTTSSLRFRSGSGNGTSQFMHCSSNGLALVPIDHGCCLPCYEKLEETSFVWMGWNQTKQPFGAKELELIENLDSWKDAEILRKELNNELEENALMTLHICTSLLKLCARKGLSAYDIGSLMCRTQLDQPCTLEVMVAKTMEKASFGCNQDEFITTFNEIVLDTIKPVEVQRRHSN